MPTQSEHIAQAQHNRDFWNGFDLKTTRFLDWVTIGIFYEGVHWVEAFLSLRGEHSDNHRRRLQAMQKNRKELGPVIADLEILKQESENARYRCHKHTASEISNDLIPVANEISNHIRKIFQSSASANP